MVKIRPMAVFVAQLAEQSLPISEVCGSNPVISKILYRTCFTFNCWNTKIMKKRDRNRPFRINSPNKIFTKSWSIENNDYTVISSLLVMARGCQSRGRGFVSMYWMGHTGWVILDGHTGWVKLDTGWVILDQTQKKRSRMAYFY